MKTFIITLKSFQPAIDTAEVCYESCLKFGFEPEIFWGVEGSDAAAVIEDLGIKMSTNHAARVIQKAHRPGQQGCFLSHYFLWKECIKRDEPIVILENDTIIIRPFPDVAWKGVLQLNPRRYDGLDPDELNAPDTVRDHVHVFLGYKGMNGTQALAIKPDAAQKFVDATHEDGFLPVDGFMKPEIAHLEEISPRVAIINKEFCYSLTRDYEQLTGQAPGGAPPGPPGGMRLTAAGAGGAQGMDPEKPETWGRVSRNQPCPCGSGKKYKHCHGAIATGNRPSGA